MFYDQEIRSLQQTVSVLPNSFKSLHPFLDEQLLRVGGRLQYSTLSYENKH